MKVRFLNITILVLGIVLVLFGVKATIRLEYIALVNFLIGFAMIVYGIKHIKAHQ